ncbi:MAG: hypothetical protein SFU25_00350 [Candidatus Caenarcaniphilales bacterium]|nr:hypothetical protein [Candidatus Caenarcaniphilales bacterium]
MAFQASILFSKSLNLKTSKQQKIEYALKADEIINPKDYIKVALESLKKQSELTIVERLWRIQNEVDFFLTKEKIHAIREKITFHTKYFGIIDLKAFPAIKAVHELAIKFYDNILQEAKVLAHSITLNFPMLDLNICLPETSKLIYRLAEAIEAHREQIKNLIKQENYLASDTLQTPTPEQAQETKLQKV